MNNNDRIAVMLHHRISHLKPGDPIQQPISPASTFLVPGTPDTHHQYGRWSNPTWDALESALAVLEGAEVAIFPSGMSAIAAVFMSLLKSGDKILLQGDGYYTTRLIAEKYLAPMGIAADLCDTLAFESTDLTGYKLVFLETPSNPGLDICDLTLLSSRAKEAGAILVVDNTTMTPLGQRPLDLGAEIVASADTKAINGHSDVVFGHVASRNADLLGEIRDWRKFVGAIPGPFESWLVLRSLETLDVRYERMCNSALTIAERLQECDVVTSVRYPGLESHPQHELSQSQMQAFGSVIGITFASTEAAEHFISHSAYIVPSTSFGGTHTSAERRARWGDAVADGYVRLSIGCEPLEALWSSMESALNSMS